MTDTKDYPIRRFLGEVAAAAARGDRGTLAELRRGQSPTTQEAAWPHIAPYCPDFEKDAPRAVWCTVGALAALLIPDHLDSSERWRNLGTTMRELAKGTGGEDEKALKSFEPKFRRLLSCTDTLSLCELVGGIGRAASARGVKMNLCSLFKDLLSWDDPEKREKTRLDWAQQFFRFYEPATTSAPVEAAP